MYFIKMACFTFSQAQTLLSLTLSEKTYNSLIHHLMAILHRSQTEVKLFYMLVLDNFSSFFHKTKAFRLDDLNDCESTLPKSSWRNYPICLFEHFRGQLLFLLSVIEWETSQAQVHSQSPNSCTVTGPDIVGVRRLVRHIKIQKERNYRILFHC